MDGIDILVTLGGITIIGLLLRQMACNRRADQARAHHEEMRRHWRVIDRLETYGYFTEPAPSFVPAEWEQEAA